MVPSPGVDLSNSVHVTSLIYHVFHLKKKGNLKFTNATDVNTIAVYYGVIGALQKLKPEINLRYQVLDKEKTWILSCSICQGKA